MYKIIAKNGCFFCEVMKKSLEELGVEYSLVEVSKGVVPLLYFNGELVFTGLPEYKELIKFVESKR